MTRGKETRDVLHHGRGCPEPPLTEFVGSHGDLIERCDECERWRSLGPADEVLAERIVNGRRGRYVCRVHGQPVTWKGTGCAGCASERAQARARRRNRSEAGS